MTTATDQPKTGLARLATDLPTAQRLAELLAEALDPQSSAVSLFETAAGWTAEVLFHNEGDRSRIAAAVSEAAGPAAAEALAFGTVEPDDWVAASLQGLPPVAAGRFVLHGGHDRHRVGPNRIGIEIEAALAFGTGHHGTTRGCLLALDAILKCGRRRRPRVLDVGTGSGVLAIAAARALRSAVVASDIDPTAVAVAAGNARLNRAAAWLRPFAASGVDAGRFRIGGGYDLIFANILEAPLRRMSAPFGRLLARDGRMVLSGLLPAHAAGVIAAYRRQGLVLERRLALDGWVTLVMRRGIFPRERRKAKRPG